MSSRDGRSEVRGTEDVVQAMWAVRAAEPSPLLLAVNVRQDLHPPPASRSLEKAFLEQAAGVPVSANDGAALGNRVSNQVEEQVVPPHPRVGGPFDVDLSEVRQNSERDHLGQWVDAEDLADRFVVVEFAMREVATKL